MYIKKKKRAKYINFNTCCQTLHMFKFKTRYRNKFYNHTQLGFSDCAFILAVNMRSSFGFSLVSVFFNHTGDNYIKTVNDIYQTKWHAVHIHFICTFHCTYSSLNSFSNCQYLRNRVRFCSYR